MKISDEDLVGLRDLAIVAAMRAGKLIQGHVGESLVVERKEAGDTQASQVVTEVDRLAQGEILDVLEESIVAFDLGLLAEEKESDQSRFEKDHFWCVDPLDGTLPFTEKRSGYSVSIALVSREGRSQVGVVYDPRKDVLYDAVLGVGARRNRETWFVGDSGEAGRVLSVFADRSLLGDKRFAEIEVELRTAAYEKGLEGVEIIAQGGAALNACWTLENAPACYFKFPKKKKGGGSLWDFAASGCLYSEAGGVFGDIEGRALELNRKESTFLNHRGVCCATHAWIADRIRGFYTKAD